MIDLGKASDVTKLLPPEEEIDFAGVLGRVS